MAIKGVKMTYENYLKSRMWGRIRTRVIERDGGICFY